MSEEFEELRAQVRYAERLCLRTARLYRKFDAALKVLTILGGSAVFTALSEAFPNWVAVLGAVVMTLFGALAIVIRPLERVLANERDARRYAELRTASTTMDLAALTVALAKARESDEREVEPLRDVAYNDVVVELGFPDRRVPLKGRQRLLEVLA